MRRIALITATALAALACGALPSGALAHGHHHGHRYARRARHHRRGPHAGLFGATTGNGAQQTSSGDTSGTAPSTSSGTHGTENIGPTADTQQGDAGKIVSFTEGVLTIEMGEGEKATKISGKVTDETEIHCIPAPTATTTPAPSTTAPPSGDDGWSGWGQQQGQQDESSSSLDDQGSGDDREGVDSNTEGVDSNTEGGEHCQQCSPEDLTPGTIVHRAELQLTESGAVFREIELVH